MPSLLGERNICICRLCRLYAHYLSCTKKKCAISLHIVRKSRCAVSLHLVCILRVFTKCLHSLHKVCICFHKLITKCALSVPDADFADLVQTLQTWCRLCRLGATKSLFNPFWRARRTNTIGLIAPKLCRPRDFARNRRIPKGRFHSRQ